MEDNISPEEQQHAEGLRVNPRTGQEYQATSWATIDLGPWLRGEKVIAPPRYLPNTEGRSIIYPGRPHVFFGASESLKSWAALLACRYVLETGSEAVYVDFEGSEGSFVERARHTGIPDAALTTGQVAYIRPTEPLGGMGAVDFWLHAMEMANPSLVVLDGVTECYSLHGWDINNATDAARFQAMFRFPDITASIAIDHTAKDAGRGVIGSQHKRAGLDGAEFEFHPVTRGGRGGTSRSRMAVTKDRHGFIREWANPVVGYLVVDTDGVRLEAPSLADIIDPHSDMMDFVEAFVRENPGSSKSKVRAGVTGSATAIDDAINALLIVRRIEDRGTDSRHLYFTPDAV